MQPCPSCGREVAPDFRLCPYCGTALAAPPAAREERKHVTVLFCDLVGFTRRSEALDPEDVRALLSGYHARLRSELERFGGTVEKFIGDAVVAVFGAPVAHEDDPERAVRAALAIRDWAREQDGLEVRIAVNTGEALVSLGANPDRGEGMVAGDVVNTAARLQSAAPVNGVLVGEATHRATRDRIDYRDAEPVTAKGKSEPVPVWEPVEPRSRLGVDTVHASAAALVGRERELALLVDAFARARAQREPQLVTLIGVPGIGKSRLVYELMQAADADPDTILWRQGRCLPYGDGVTFWALGEIVKSQAGIFETDEAGRAAEKLEATVAELIGEAADAGWVGQHLAPLIGLAAEAGVHEDRESEAFTAWLRFFEALAERAPLVLVIEDLHWADEKLLDFVDELADRAADVPILVVATARPELLDRRPSWGGGKANAVTLSLAPLADDETARLLGSLLQRAVLPAEVQQTLLARAGGNPLFAEQYARMLAEHGDGADLPLPGSVHGIIAARLDGLAPPEKALLHDAAVLGKVFWTGALQAMSGALRDDLDAALRALERKEFLRRQRRASVAGETEYTFRHALLRDVAYGQIPRPERAERHRRAAEWLDSIAHGRDDHAELLADHYLRAFELARAAGAETAELARRAREALRDAGARASALNAFDAAVRYLDRAAELWPGDDPERPELLALRAKALHFTGAEFQVEALEEARDALLAAGVRHRAAELETLLAEVWWHRGDRDRAFVHLDRGAALAAGAAPSREQALVLSQVARYRAIAGDSAPAVAAAEQALAMAEALGDEELKGHALNNLGIAKTAGGDVDGGLADAERAVELTLAANSPEAARAYNNLAYILDARGERERSEEASQEADRQAERFGDVQLLRFRRSAQAWRDFMAGDWDDALRLADRFIAECEAGSPHYQEASMRDLRASIRLWRDDEEGALADVRRALELARMAKDPQIILSALASGLAVTSWSGRSDEARSLALELLRHEPTQVAQQGGALFFLAASVSELGLEREVSELLAQAPDTPQAEVARAIASDNWLAALEIQEGLKILPPEALCRLRAAEALVVEGRRAEADAQLRRALAFFHSVGATRFVREAERLLAATA